MKANLRSILVVSAALLPLIAGVGCAGEDASSTAARQTAAQAERAASERDAAETDETLAEPSVGYGSVTGRIVLEGEIPTLPPLVLAGSDVRDSATCAAHDVPDESLVVDPSTRGIANAFVYLARLPAGIEVPREFAQVPSEPVVLDQRGCRFIPRCLFVRAGQPMQVVSGDPIAHNVHPQPTRNPSVNLTVGANDREGIEFVYQVGERRPVRVGCDIHSWMAGWHLVLEHPYAAVTGPDGSFTIRGLPAGQYEFTVWHEAAEGNVITDALEAVVVEGTTTQLDPYAVPVERFEVRSASELQAAR